MSNFSIILEPLHSPLNEISVSLNNVGISKLQSYNPIYSLFNSDPPENCGLNNTFQIVDLHTHDNLVATLKATSLPTVGEKNKNYLIKKPIFIKYSPLLDPIRYLLGKYDNFQNILRKHSKILLSPTIF